MPIICKSNQELEKMRRSGRILRQVLEMLRGMVAPGITTWDLEQAAAAKINELGGKAAFKGQYDYPCVLCTSVNQEVVHGIPSKKRVLKAGDIVSIDCGIIYDGYYSDSAITVPVGGVEAVSANVARLLEVTRKALEIAIEHAKLDNRVGDIGAAVQEYVEAQGFSVVRELTGHGIGRKLHEDPQVPNYGSRGSGPRLREGMTLAIEPMVNIGRPNVKTLEDGWTQVTEDGSYSAHFEHSIAITKDGPVILTA
ncbi:MAG: type I methionyl aminopeptidase [Acidobacteriales bacterium]|nr:type I methionyl aminopeptidase [Terriglobales bacterium]